MNRVLVVAALFSGCLMGLILGSNYGKYSVEERALANAHNELRVLYSRIEIFPTVEGEKVYAWPTDVLLPVGVIPLHEQEKGGQLPLEGNYPLAYRRPNFSKDQVLVLLSNGSREIMTIEEFQSAGKSPVCC